MKRLQRFEIEQECIALSNAFAYHLDRQEYEALANLFAEDGTWIRHYIKLQGHAQILAAMRERPSDQFTRHVTSSFHFTEVTETQAKSVSCNISYFSFDAAKLPTLYKPSDAMLLDFVDAFTKTQKGWRFLERDTQMVLVPEQVMNASDH
jgi:hypothetical protein